MRRLPSLAVLSLVLAANVYAGRVTIEKPTITWVTGDAVNRACASTRPIAACTIMANTTLTCDCIASKNQWTRRVKVSVAPETITTTSTVLLHEMAHVADIRTMLNQYVRRVEERKFVTPNECEAAAARVRAGFDDELAAIRDETARKRDGIAVGEVTSLALERQVVPPPSPDDQSASGGDESDCAPAPADPGLQPFLAASKCR